MKNKIIIGLIISILLLFVYFFSYRLNIERERTEELQNQIRVFERQIELNNEDFDNYQEQLEKEKKKNEKLSKEIKVVFKDDTCVNALVSESFIEFLSKNNNK